MKPIRNQQAESGLPLMPNGKPLSRTLSATIRPPPLLFPYRNAGAVMKNPFMSAWLSWANSATTAWTGAMTAAARCNQAAMMQAALKPPKAKRKPRPKKKS